MAIVGSTSHPETPPEASPAPPAEQPGRPPEMPESLLARLFRPVDIASLAFFRFAFGAIMLWDVAKHFYYDWIYEIYLRPVFHFTYFGFEWVQPWPPHWMYIHFFTTGLAALGIALGVLYRFSATVFFLGWSYIFLVEKAAYMNHYYLVALIALVMIFVPAHRAWSIDALLRPHIRTAFAPAWCLWLVRLHVAIPYFYGGLAKLNADWLRGQPMGMWMADQTERVPLLGEFFTERWMVLLFSWGGAAFDLLIVPLLLWRRTRAFAICWAVVFHLLNHLMFDIGIFPWLMICATLMFLPPNWPRRLLETRRPRLPQLLAQSPRLTTGRRIGLTVAGLYIAFQLLFPLRHFLYPGNPSWTEEGHYFSWHMMLREKFNGVRFIATDPETGRTGPITDIDLYITQYQLDKMGRNPDMIWEFAQYLESQFKRHGVEDAEIRVIALTSLNGRKPQLLIDPTVDLTEVERSLWHKDWIVQLVEPLRSEPWDKPLLEWEQHVDTSHRPDR